MVQFFKHNVRKVGLSVHIVQFLFLCLQQGIKLVSSPLRSLIWLHFNSTHNKKTYSKSNMLPQPSLSQNVDVTTASD